MMCLAMKLVPAEVVVPVLLLAARHWPPHFAIPPVLAKALTQPVLLLAAPRPVLFLMAPRPVLFLTARPVLHHAGVRGESRATWAMVACSHAKRRGTREQAPLDTGASKVDPAGGRLAPIYSGSPLSAQPVHGAAAAKAVGPLGPIALGCRHRAEPAAVAFYSPKDVHGAYSAKRGALWQARLWWVPGPPLPPGCQPGLKGSVSNSRRGSSGPRAASGGAVARVALISNYVPPPPLASRSVSAVGANRGIVGMAHSILELGPIPTRGV